MLQLTPLSTRSRELRPVAFVEDENNDPQGWLRVGENSNIGEELIELPDGLHFTITPTTRENQNDRIYTVGASGCGKSSFVASYCRSFLRMFPHTEPEDISIISSEDIDDPAYEGIPHRRINVNDEEFVLNPPTLEEFINKKEGGKSIIIYDDIEGIRDKKKLNALNSILDASLTMGRKHGIQILMCAHVGANSNRSKTILSELTSIVFFPKGGSIGRNFSYMLSHHLGIDPMLKETLKKSECCGRWVCLQLQAPQMLITEKMAAMYDPDEVQKSIKKRTLLDRKRANKEAEEMLNHERY